jgi:hypothetical protein
MCELLVQGVIEAQLGSEPGQRFRVGPLADHRLYRITGSDVQQQKGDQ